MSHDVDLGLAVLVGLSECDLSLDDGEFHAFDNITIREVEERDRGGALLGPVTV